MTSPRVPEHTPEHTFVHSRGVRLHVTLQGPVRYSEVSDPSLRTPADEPADHANSSVPLVLFIHGFGGGWFDWQLLLNQFGGAPFRLAAVDLRGYGRSDKTPRGYDLTTAASDMAGVIRGLGYSSAFVVGHGHGGMVAWTLAAHEPDRVRAVVTLSSAHPTEQAKHIVIRPLTQWKRASSMLFAQLPRVPERKLTKDDAAAAERIFRGRVAPGFRDTDIYHRFADLRREAMLVPKVAHLASEYRRWTFRSRFRPEGRMFDRTFPKQISAPVLAIDGSMDPDYSPDLAAASIARAASVTPAATGASTSEPMASADPAAGGSRTELIYGVGHYPHIEDPEATADLIKAYFTEH